MGSCEQVKNLRVPCKSLGILIVSCILLCHSYNYTETIPSLATMSISLKIYQKQHFFDLHDYLTFHRPRVRNTSNFSKRIHNDKNLRTLSSINIVA